MHTHFRILVVGVKFCVVANRVMHFSVCVTLVAHTFLLKEVNTMSINDMLNSEYGLMALVISALLVTIIFAVAGWVKKNKK